MRTTTFEAEARNGPLEQRTQATAAVVAPGDGSHGEAVVDRGLRVSQQHEGGG